MAKKRTRDELIEAAGHVCYEIQMLHLLERAIVHGLAGNQLTRNALINSFAIHVRNLIDFLYEPKGDSKPDMILAEHYFTTRDEWCKTRLPMSDKLKRAKIRCDKQVAHLTYTRKNKESWNVTTIVREVHFVLCAFVGNINISLLGDHFKLIKPYFKVD